ncbi:MAG: hypothetical protein KIG64_02060 [Bacteroidales bacterium]|nr:hypothetical protein [Bacteroidales bacterium]
MGKKIAKTWRKQQIIVGIVGFKAYLCHCFIKIIAIPLIIRRIAIIFLQCRMCGRLSPPGPVPTLGTLEGGAHKRSAVGGMERSGRFRRRAADARRHLNIKKEDDFLVTLILFSITGDN